VLVPETALSASGADLRGVVKSAAKLKRLAPQTVVVADPLPYSGVAPGSDRKLTSRITTTGSITRPVHPVSVWRGRIGVALDAPGDGARIPRSSGAAPRADGGHQGAAAHRGPGAHPDRCRDALRLKSFLLMCRNSSRD
jgi:RND superfamily putative drug exporter